MSQAMIDLVTQTDQLPSAPGVAMRIVELNQSDDVDVAQLSEVLAQDPALVAKVIKTANSSMFGVPREVSDVRQAVMILGLRTVNLLALSFSAVAVARGGSPDGFDYRAFWTQSLGTALAARALAKEHRPALEDEAFLAGLLADLGRLVMAEGQPEAYTPVCTAARDADEPLWQIEKRLLEVDHMQVGQKLFEHWCLPRRVCLAIGAHHEPERIETDPNACRLAEILHLASACGELYGGMTLLGSASLIYELGERYFGMRSDDCEAFLGTIADRLPEAAEALELTSADPATLAAIRTRATELMLKASLSLEQQVQAVQHQVQELETRAESLEMQAQTDALTGLRNRGHFDEILASELARARQLGSPLGLILIDLDHFKSVNDDYGHSAGDDLLRAAARAIESAATGAIASRYGGEEFAVICPGDACEQIEERAERIRAAIGQSEIQTTRGRLSRSASVGIAHGTGSALPERVAPLLEAADQQLYRAKEQGRDCCCLHRF